MNAIPRRRLGWKILAAVLAVVIAAAAGIAVRIRSLAAKKEDEWTRRLQELAAEVQPGDHRRPVLRGTPLPGNAWDDYLQAAAELDKIPKDALKSRALRSVAPGQEDWAALIQFQENHPEILEKARRGTRRDVSRHPEFDRDLTGTYARFPEIRLRPLWLLGVACGRILLAQKQFRELGDHWLDMAVFAADLGNHPCGMGWSSCFEVYETALAGVKELLAAPEVRAEDLEVMSRGLAIVDRNFPSQWLPVRRYQYYRGRILPEEEFNLGGDCVKRTPGVLDAWRYGFSEKLMLFAGLQEIDRSMERWRNIDEMPFGEVQTMHTAMVGIKTSVNPVFEAHCPDLLYWTVAWRTPRARLRLLLAAAHYRATGEVPDLADPFGTRLGHSRTGSTLRLWSIGRDGTDQGGQGDWTNTRGKDIVLEVTR